RKEVSNEYLIGVLNTKPGYISKIIEKEQFIGKLNCFLVSCETSINFKRAVNKDLGRFKSSELRSEIWKKSERLDSQYEVSNLGRIRKVLGDTFTICLKNLKQIKQKNRKSIRCFSVVTLKDCNGKWKEFKVAQLVAELYLHGFQKGKTSVIAKDENSWNTRADNLLVLSKQETGKLTQKRNKQYKYVAKLDQLTLEPVAIYKGMENAASKNNITSRSLRFATREDNPSDKYNDSERVMAGYRWMQIDDIEVFTDRYEYLCVE
ncbi:MAG: NUMOD4 domain-containing protein, partial [Paraclostridium sp.]